MGCLLKTNKSAVLVAKVQDMTDRYDIANLQKHIFFSNWKNFLSSLYFIFSRIIHLEMFIDFFSFYTEFCQHIQFKKKKKNGESGYRSQYFPHAKRVLYHLS